MESRLACFAFSGYKISAVLYNLVQKLLRFSYFGPAKQCCNNGMQDLLKKIYTIFSMGGGGNISE